MHRLIPEIRAINLPTGIKPVERAHWAAALGELVEVMTSILAMALARKTGVVPSLRIASNETMTVICDGGIAANRLPISLVFDRNFMNRMLLVWDGHTSRDPEDASTYLLVTSDEYVIGIAGRELVDAVETGDRDAVLSAMKGAARVTGAPHGPG